MFESAELGHTVDKETWHREEPKLREALLAAQYDVRKAARFPVILVIGGVDGAGKGETANLLNEWMDPRYIQTHAFGDPTDEERERPPMFRFWRALPPKGRIGIFIGSWYSMPIVARVHGEIDDNELDARLGEIVAFEKMLSDEGALLLKFWFHLSKKNQKIRLKKLEASPHTRWRVTKDDWKNFALYAKYRKTSERALRETSRNEAPWLVVEGTDERYRSLTVGRATLEAVKARLAHTPRASKAGRSARRTDPPPSVVAIDSKSLIEAIDLSKKLDGDSYEVQLEKYQRKLNLLLRHPEAKHISVIALFEGPDAAGKGGAIRRVTGALDARRYRVFPIAAPSEEERAQPYLWRFWRRLPRRGHMAIFDRSWYGRVLVERVEGYTSTADWMRAYAEINDFEEQLVRDRIVVAKFWLQISKREQLRRFREREKVGFKRFKLTGEDWRNREKWGDYEIATCDMVDRTSTEIANWALIPAENKEYGRIDVLKRLCARIERALEG